VYLLETGIKKENNKEQHESQDIKKKPCQDHARSVI
jgi:hypothetical protein